MQHLNDNHALCAQLQTEVASEMFDYNLTRMEDLAHGHREVPVGFKVLRYGCVVSGMDPPVGVEIVNSGRVWSAARQHGGPTGGTHSLLRRKNTFKQVSEPTIKHRHDQRLTCACALRKT